MDMVAQHDADLLKFFQDITKVEMELNALKIAVFMAKVTAETEAAKHAVEVNALKIDVSLAYIAVTSEAVKHVIEVNALTAKHAVEVKALKDEVAVAKVAAAEAAKHAVEHTSHQRLDATHAPIVIDADNEMEEEEVAITDDEMDEEEVAITDDEADFPPNADRSEEEEQDDIDDIKALSFFYGIVGRSIYSWKARVDRVYNKLWCVLERPDTWGREWPPNFANLRGHTLKLDVLIAICRWWRVNEVGYIYD